MTVKSSRLGTTIFLERPNPPQLLKRGPRQRGPDGRRSPMAVGFGARWVIIDFPLDVDPCLLFKQYPGFSYYFLMTLTPDSNRLILLNVVLVKEHFAFQTR